MNIIFIMFTMMVQIILITLLVEEDYDDDD